MTVTINYYNLHFFHKMISFAGMYIKIDTQCVEGQKQAIVEEFKKKSQRTMTKNKEDIFIKNEKRNKPKYKKKRELNKDGCVRLAHSPKLQSQNGHAQSKNNSKNAGLQYQ